MAVGPVASLVSSTDLEGIDGAWNQTSNCHCVCFTEDAHSTVLIRPLPDRETAISVRIRAIYLQLVKLLTHIYTSIFFNKTSNTCRVEGLEMNKKIEIKDQNFILPACA